MKIYRLEHRERGCGPYDGVMKNFTRLSHRRIISMADSCMVSAMPESDKMLTTWEPRHISEKLPGSEKFFFGVKSLESLFKWFNRPFHRCVNVRWGFFGPFYDEKVPTNETILQMLILTGFVIREYEVEETSEVYLEPDDGVQVVFKKENAVRVRTLS